MEKLPADSVVILAAKDDSWMSHDIPFPYRQDPDFFYLTGLNEPEALLILQGRKAEMTLLVRHRDKSREIWDGPRAGLEGAQSIFGAHHAGDVKRDTQKSTAQAISAALAAGGQVFVDQARIPASHKLDKVLTDVPAQACSSPARHIEDLRAIKSRAEVDLMRAAGQVTAASFCDAITATRGMKTEAELSAHLEFGFKKRGAEKLAYPCVVAGGSNACTLHYIANNQPLPQNGLVLVDAGCELHGYASDVTRTWPCSGSFTPPQRALYEAVLDCQLRCIEAARADQGVSHAQLHTLSVQILAQHLIHLGILTPERINEYSRFYPHSIGHQLGIDTHDVPAVSMSRALQPGMVITIEPGLYVPLDAPSWVPDEFRGIGIRIEDDIVIREAGVPEVLTDFVPKEVDALEALMS